MRTVADELPERQVVLLGIGHTNAHVLRMWAKQPLDATGLTCISDRPVATYSGMLPAVLAGRNSPGDMEIDLVRLCAAVGARLIVAEVSHVDSDARLVHFADRPPVPFDVLSVGVGSVPTTEGVDVQTRNLLKIKPMQTFLQRLKQAVAAAVARQGRDRIRIAIAGSGVAGIEIAFCLSGFLKEKVPGYNLKIVTRSEEILSGAIPSFRKEVLRRLAVSGVMVITGKSIVSADGEGLWLNDGTNVEADLIVWATGASAPPLLSQLGLPLTDDGFVATDSTLKSTSGKPVFAVGDTGSIVTERLPKAGVYAVRQGPILWTNLGRELRGQPLIQYQPQKSFLKLLNTGDGDAVGEYQGFCFSGRWVMKLKDRIDSRFMQMFQMLGGMKTAQQMQCRGCGCKLGGDVLASVIQSETETSEGPGQLSVMLDDAAVIPMASGDSVLASTDFFTSPFDDAYLSGRIAALHSASDLVAMGATIRAALANVVLPEGSPNAQKQVFSDLMAGAKREFEAMGAAIVGGHTIVGPRLEVGFTVVGEPHTHGSDSPLLCKSGLAVGDRLYLTKPLGIGVLLAAHMMNECRAADYQAVVETMLRHQSEYALEARNFGIRAATDVTGFGLIGHLIEMLQASGLSASIELSSVPLLNGAALALIAGIESTLAPGNRHVESLVRIDPAKRSYPEYKALFDPQTCGGLLLAVPESHCAAFEKRFNDSGFIPTRIGTVIEEAKDLVSVT